MDVDVMLLELFLVLCIVYSPVINGDECSFDDHLVYSLNAEDEGVVTSYKYPNQYPRSQMVCDINLHTCGDCVIEVQFAEFSYPSCGRRDADKPLTSEMYCDYYNYCEYFIIKDNDHPLLIYDGNRTGSSYRSKGNSLQLRFCYSTSYSNDSPRKWMFRYKVIEKIPVFTTDSAGGHLVLQSEGYPRRYSSQKKRYLLRNPDLSGRMVLLFDDLVLSHSSVLKIYDGPDSRALSTVRRSFQRSMFTSSGPEVLLVFDPGPTRGDWVYQPGFKLRAEFNESKHSTYRLRRHFSTSIVDSLNQGYIWFQTKHRVDHEAYYDYVWYVRAPEGLRTFIKVVKFIWWGDLQLEIRNGNNSQGRLAQTLTKQHNGWVDRMGGYDSYTGFYLRLTGKSASLDSFLMAVTAFSAQSSHNKKDCELQYRAISQRGFYCVSDSRCIPEARRCDGLAHCSSAVDENGAHCPNPVTIAYTMAPPVITTLAPCLMKPPFMFRCDEDQNLCVYATKKCNGQNDCPNGSDEKYCHPSVTGHGGASTPVRLGPRGTAEGAPEEDMIPHDPDTVWLYSLFGVFCVITIVFMVMYRQCQKRSNEGQVEAQTSDSRLHTARLRLSRYIYSRSHRNRNGTPSSGAHRHQSRRDDHHANHAGHAGHVSNRHRPSTRFNFEDDVIATIVNSREPVRFQRGRPQLSPRSDYLSDPASPRSMDGENPYEQIGPRSPNSYHDFLDDRENGSYRLYGSRSDGPPSYDEILGGHVTTPSALDDSYMTQESLPSYDEVRELIPHPRPSRQRLGSDNPASENADMPV